MNFIIGSGYHRKSDWNERFAWTWYNAIRRYAPFPKRIVIISTGHNFPVVASEIDVIRGVNLGHVGDEGYNNALRGWSASVMALSLIAYNCQSDLIYLEEDCLAIGKWVEQAYMDMAEADMVFGYRHIKEPYQVCSQSLFIIKHRFLLEFVRRYLALVPDLNLLPENKFALLESGDPKRFARLSFGVDRERPIPYDSPVWYSQQNTEEEINEMKARGLI